MPVEKLKALAEKAGKSLPEVEKAWEEAKEATGPERDDGKYWGTVMKITKNKLGIKEEQDYGEMYWLQLVEAQDFGQRILSYLKKRLKVKEGTEDLDDEMAARFRIKPAQAGNILELYVRHKGGAMNEKEFVRKVNGMR